MPQPLPFPTLNADRQYDARLGIPPGFVHFPGKRLTLTCRTLGIECAAVIVGEGSKKFGPKLEGVLIRCSDQKALQEGVVKRDASRPSPEQKAIRKATQQTNETEAFAAEIRTGFPAMPEEDVLACAHHATEIGSGRVGRSSQAKNSPLRAVIAHIRHQYTPYDKLLEDGLPRDEARANILEMVRARANLWSPGRVVCIKDGAARKRRKNNFR